MNVLMLLFDSTRLPLGKDTGDIAPWTAAEREGAGQEDGEARAHLESERRERRHREAVKRLGPPSDWGTGAGVGWQRACPRPGSRRRRS